MALVVRGMDGIKGAQARGAHTSVQQGAQCEFTAPVEVLICEKASVLRPAGTMFHGVSLDHGR